MCACVGAYVPACVRACMCTISLDILLKCLARCQPNALFCATKSELLNIAMEKTPKNAGMRIGAHVRAPAHTCEGMCRFQRVRPTSKRRAKAKG